MVFSRSLIVGALVFAFASASHAQKWNGCLGGEGRQEQKIGEFSISVSRHPRADLAEFQDECIAEIKDATDKVLFSSHGHGLEILPITGADLDGDGDPDVVIEGYSGGAHCCWTYWIFSVGKSPRLLARFYNERPISFEKIEGHTGITLATLDGRFDYFDGMCHACSPFPSVYLRLEGSRIVDISTEYWAEYDTEIEGAREGLSLTELSEFRNEWRKRQPTDRNTFEEIRENVLYIVLGYLYAGKSDEAWKTLGEMWPPSDFRRIKRLILKTRGKGFVAWAQDPSNFDD
jgi:hypothetical protein